LKVEEGTVLTIPGRFRETYDDFVMEDDSKIVALGDFNLTALRAVIGNNCIIEGNGTNGKRGEKITAKPKQAGYQKEGTPGYPGKPGKPGTRGRNITLVLYLQSLGSLRVISKGGAGGPGGTGGRGGQGGGAKCLPLTFARIGGPGGIGGEGGLGGPGGKVSIRFGSVRDGQSAASFRSGIKVVSTQQGTGGLGGGGGKGGDGGAGATCGPIRTIPGGERGPEGEPGVSHREDARARTPYEIIAI
jgi:hypothetical protein